MKWLYGWLVITCALRLAKYEIHSLDMDEIMNQNANTRYYDLCEQAINCTTFR